MDIGSNTNCNFHDLLNHSINNRINFIENDMWEGENKGVAVPYRSWITKKKNEKKKTYSDYFDYTINVLNKL